MKHTCPKCGHEWEAPSANQQAGGKARWKGTKKKDRSAAAKAAAEARSVLRLVSWMVEYLLDTKPIL